MQKYVLMSTNWPDTRGFFPSKTSISFKIRHKLTLLPYMSNILCLYKQFALYFEWKCHIFGKNWCTGELTFHRWIGEIISPVFHRCTSVEYLTLIESILRTNLVPHTPFCLRGAGDAISRHILASHDVSRNFRLCSDWRVVVVGGSPASCRRLNCDP